MKRHLHVVAIAAIASAITAGAIQTLLTARADQYELIPPTSGIYTGPQFSQLLGNAFRSLASCNKGPAAPAVVAGTAVDGLCWIDDHASPWLSKRYVDGNWIVEGAIDNVTGQYIGAVGGGAAALASTSTVDLGSVPQASVTVTGTAAVANFGASAPLGAIKFLEFDNILVLTHSGNLIVPGGFPLTTAAGDTATARHVGLGVWKITQYTRANGVPIDIAAVGKPDFSFQAGTPALYLPGDGRAILRASYPAYTAKMSRAQNGTRTSGNATIASVADTSKMGVGMPVEGTGINAGCTIVSLVANTSITLNSSSCVTSSGTSTVTVFLTGYGAGGDATKIGVPNCAGATLAGRETAPTRLTSSFFGANSTVMGSFGGSEYNVLSQPNLPNVNFSIIEPNSGQGHQHLTAVSDPATTGRSNGTTTPNDVWGGGGSSAKSSTFSTTGITVNSGGSSTPLRSVQPTLIADCNVRVIP